MLIFSVLTYIAIAGVNCYFREYAFSKGYMKKDGEFSDFVTVVTSLLWPIYLPALFAYTYMKRPKKTEEELFKGVPKPTNILAGMVAANILQNFEKLEKGPFKSYTYETDKIYLYFSVRQDVVHVHAFRVNSCDFEANEELKKACLNSVKLLEQKLFDEQLFKQEESALTAIETL